MPSDNEAAFTIRVRFPTEAERHVLENLFDRIEFARFYAENRPRITADVFWWITDPSEPPDCYQCFPCQRPDGSAYFVICLPNMPPQVHEAPKVAHELSHILLMQDGYPTVNAPGNGLLKAVGGMLGSLLSDLVIDRWLTEQYQLQTRTNVEQHLINITTGIKSKPLPKDSLIYAQWVLSFVDTILQHELVTGEATLPLLDQRLAERHPKLVRDVDKLLKIIRTLGYDSPEQQERLLRQIISRLRLEKYGFRLSKHGDRNNKL